MDVWVAATERQRTHGDLVNLSAGQPSTPAPAPVRAAAVEALSSDVLGYTVAVGIQELRTAIAAFYQQRYGVPVDRDDVVATTGSSGGFLLSFLAAFDAGDRVALARPGYPCYRNILRALGCEVVELDCGPGSRFQPTVEMLEQAHRQQPLRGLILASPANPTGTVLEPAELARIATWCEQAGVQLVSDEIYHGISYPGTPQTACAWQTSREAIVVNSFSKYFSMTGWRLGWLVVPDALVAPIEKLAQNLYICPSTLAQHAALACFEPESIAEYERRRDEFRARRDFLVPALNAIGLTVPVMPDGAFYAWADCSQHNASSWDFCHEVMQQAHVAVTPGRDFGHHGTERYVRLSYASSMEHLHEAVERLRRMLA